MAITDPIRSSYALYAIGGVFKSGNSVTGSPEASYVAEYNFFDGDTYAQIKNGFAWSGSKPISAPSGETEQGGQFTFAGNPDPRVQPTSEQRYSFDEMDEFWIKKRFFIPANYYHRSFTGFTVTGDMSSWQRGDSLLANNGVDTGTVEYISGDYLAVLFPTNPYDYNWDGNITNTTRSQTLACDRTGIWPDNNKFHALWCDDYSFHGASPTIVWELRAAGNGGSDLYYHFGADFQVVGTLPNSTSTAATFITPADFGKWFDWIAHVKMASSEASADGIIEHWVRRDGESVYTKLHTQTNCLIGARAAADGAQFQNGYCHGYQNTGYFETTYLYDSHVILSSATVDGVV